MPLKEQRWNPVPSGAVGTGSAEYRAGKAEESAIQRQLSWGFGY